MKILLKSFNKKSNKNKLIKKKWNLMFNSKLNKSSKFMKILNKKKENSNKLSIKKISKIKSLSPY